MEEEKIQRKFEELQKHLPFLDKVIEKLRINVREQPDNPRTAQLDKMEMLHDLLTNRGKKLRLDSLLKCENVIIKLHQKIEKSSSLQEGLNDVNALDGIDHDKSANGNPLCSMPNLSNIPFPDDDDDCVIVNCEFPSANHNTPHNKKVTDEKLLNKKMDVPENSRGSADWIKIEHRDKRDQPDKFGYYNRNENRDRHNSRDRHDDRECRKRHDFRDKHESRDKYESRDVLRVKHDLERHGSRGRHDSRDRLDLQDRRDSRDRLDLHDIRDSRDRHDSRESRDYQRDRHEDKNKNEQREKYENRDKHEYRDNRDYHNSSREKKDFYNDNRPRFHYDKLKDINRSESACSSRSNNSATTENEIKANPADKNQDSYFKSVFERLGDKLSGSKTENVTSNTNLNIQGVKAADIPETRRLHVNVDVPKTSRHGAKPDFTKTHVSPPINKHVNVSIRDVLKNSPLTDKDITELINENVTDESGTNSSKTVNTATAYGVGFRRAAKSQDLNNVPLTTQSSQLSTPTEGKQYSEISTHHTSSSLQLDSSRWNTKPSDKNIGGPSQELTSLEIVRKKFAMLAKGSTNIKSESQTGDFRASTTTIDCKPNITSYSNNLSLADHLTQSINKQKKDISENRFESTIIKDPRMQKRNHEQHVEQQQTYLIPTISTTNVVPSTSNVDPRLERMTNTAFMSQNYSTSEMNNPYASSALFAQNYTTPAYNADNIVQSAGIFHGNNNIGIGFSGALEGKNMQGPEFYNSSTSNSSNMMNVPNSFRSDMSERFSSRTTTQSSTFSNQSCNRYFPENIWDLKNDSYSTPQYKQDINNRFHSNRTGTQNSTYANRDNSRYSPEEIWDLDDQNSAMPQSNNDWNIKKNSVESNSNSFMSHRTWHSTNAIKSENTARDTLQRQGSVKSFSRNSTESSSSRFSVSPKGSKDFHKTNYEPSHSKLSKFNALLNDKSERVKYLESKKKKSENNSTYAEHRLAKARETSVVKSVGNSNKYDNLIKTTNDKDQEKFKSDYSQKNDKSGDVQETKKKVTEPSRKKYEESEKHEETRSSNKDSLQIKNEKTKDFEENKKKESESSERKNDKSKSIVNTQKKESKSSQMKNDKSKSVKETQKCNSLTPNETKKISSIIPEEIEKNNSIKPEKTEKSKVTSFTFERGSEDFDREAIETKNTHSKLTGTMEGEKNINSLPKISIEDIKNLPNFQQKGIPKRRNSMVEFGSALQVNKEVLPFANTILYADIQCEERSGNKTTKLSEKYSSRRHESLANIFKKTNDNCALSSQNIISGKRRSRTLVNFNEVQQTIAVFKHTKNPTKKDSKNQNDIKKDKKENKDKVENSESSTSKAKSQEEANENGSEMLEGFVQNMLKPNVNTEYIFDLLRGILPEEKLNLVKSIIESTNDEISTHSAGSKSVNKTKNASKTQVPDDEYDDDNDDEEEIPKKRIKKRNELDRLNEDIRDMFISEGVITATGKRVCTLVSASCASDGSTYVDDEENPEASDDDGEVLPSKPKPKSKKLKEKALRKFLSQKKSKISERNKTSRSKNKAEEDIIKEIKKRKFTVKLTKLKFPRTETKTVERSAAVASAETAIPKNKIVAKTPILINRNKKKLVKNRMQTSGSTKENSYHELFKRSRAKILEEDGIRNTDPRWHSLSKYAEKCVICDANMKYPGTHYIQTHAENYVSRFPATVIKKLREGALGKVLFHRKTRTWQSFSRCPFCLQYGYKSISEWLEHFTIHTGEYFYQCSYCHRTGNKPHIITRHLESGVCPKGKLIKEKPHNFDERAVKGYVCNLCNFVQMHRHNVDRHYMEQHGIEKDKVATLGFEVNLLDWNNVKTVKEKRAAVLEKKALQQKFLLIFDEDGMETEKIENEENNGEGSEEECEEEYEQDNAMEVEPHANENETELDTKREAVEDSLRELESYPLVETILGNETESEDDSKIKTKPKKLSHLEPEQTDDLQHNLISMGELENETGKITPKSSERKSEEKLETAKENIPLKVIKQEKEDNTISLPVKSTVNTSNAFLPSHRDNDSPTINFTQKLLTIQQANTIEEESEMNKSPPVESMAERLSQRFKSMENQIIISSENQLDSEENDNVHDDEMLVETEEITSEQNANEPCLAENSNYEINDYQNQDSDDDCWEDIEITEYQVSSKNKTMKSAGDNKKKQKQNQKKLHRFYASNAIRAKKIKDSYMTSKNNKVNNLKDKEIGKDCSNEDVAASERPKNLEGNSFNENSTEKDPLNTDVHFNAHSNENTQNVSVFSRGMRSGVNRISNIGFSKDQRDSYKFYCLCEFCTFLYSSESVGLENHCLSEHSKLIWTGFCYTCNKQVIPNVNTLTVAQEIGHMLDCHVTDIEDTATQDSVQSVEEHQPPRIKLRRLSGDCLSATTPILQNKNLSTNENNPSINLKSLLLEPIKPARPLESFTVPNLPDISEDVPISDLQITNVRSLNACTFSEIVPVSPKITNKLGGVQNFTIAQKSASKAQRDLSKSPEPIVVSETRPISQAHKGKYLITQTVSTKFDDHGKISSVPEHDVNISLLNMAIDINNTSLPKTTNNQNSSALTSTLSTNENTIYPENTTDTTLSANKSVYSRDGATYRCMAKNCAFKTRVSVSMINHSYFHELGSFKTERDYLRCYICEQYLDDKRLLVQHIDEHLKTDTVVKKIISNPTTMLSQNASTNAVTAVSNKQLSSPDKALLEQLKEAIYGIMSFKGIKKQELYRCIYKKCNRNCESSTNLLSHIRDHVVKEKYNAPYKCLFCTMKYSRIDALVLHLKNHGIHQYFCYLCAKTTATTGEMQQHYHQVHGRLSSGCVSMLYEPEPEEADKTSFYVWHVHNLTEQEIHQFAEKIIADWLPKKFQSKVVFNSNECGQLPLQPIFHKEIRCAECSYKTKVRTNMIRHLQMHKLGNMVISHEGSRSDPVNPMPCLNSTERHFDKMTNLASSSLVTSGSSTNNSTPVTITSTAATLANNQTESEITNISTDGDAVSSIIVPEKPPIKLKVDYDYVPETRVHTCGVKGCQYMTLSEEIFRSHVVTLHGDASAYICPFCKEEVCKRGISIARILTHLRFHGQWLYQCEDCSYVHYVKAVVRRHIHEKHVTSNKDDINLISYNRATNWQCKTAINIKSRSIISDDNIKNATNSTAVAAPSATTMTATAVSFSATTTTTTTGISNSNNNNNNSNSNKGMNRKEIRWQCDLCDHFSKTHNLIISHCNTFHGYRHRYQCGLCPTGFRQIDPVMKHFKQNHVGQKVTLKTIFHRELMDPELEPLNTGETSQQTNMETNTKPLWQRNDPQRVRHIRGILMEDEEETEQHRKRLRLDEYEDH